MRPTNLLFILSDEHSPRVLGCAGDPVVRTPHLDALAARGTRFASAYCQTPICVPSRASLATGRWAHRVESWDNAKPYTGAEAASWGHRLGAAGHRVATIGKLHYRAVDDPSGFPEQRLPLHVVAGQGDLHGLLRGDMPVRPQGRKLVLDAGPGESEYTRYDRAIAEEAVRWLTDEAPRERRPWALFVGFVTPHFPLVVPEKYWSLYPPETVPFPVQGRVEEWPRHPALDLRRRLQALDQPFDEPTLRRARAAYYGLTTFMDEQVGAVLTALGEAGLAGDTRVVYSSDHGEMLGAHGLWWKCTMYEDSVGVPMIVAGPDVPAGRVSRTPAMLVDAFPAIVEAVGASLAPEDADLPGRSLFALAAAPDAPERIAFSEFHAVYSGSAMYVLRAGRFKYIHYVGAPPQLFDLEADPDETRDLAAVPAAAATLAACERRLREIADPEAIDRAAKADQDRRLQAAGGRERIAAEGVKIVYTPAPARFTAP